MQYGRTLCYVQVTNAYNHSKLMSALWTRGDPLPHIPVDAPLLSTAAARMALHALLRANQLEHCFALANEQLSAAADLPVHAVFVNFLIGAPHAP